MVAPTTATSQPVAELRARIAAYLVDSVILLAFILAFFALAGIQFLIADSRASGDPSDAAFYALVSIFSGGSLIAWSILNVVLTRTRGQTAGMYVIGIRMVNEDGTRITTRQALLRWFGLHPLLFHPFFLVVWFVISALAFSLTLSRFAFIPSVALALMCLVSPAVNFLIVATDPSRRALHDRLARTLVVHMNQP